ncbi:hypothetical protein JCM10207_000259 [Rhodosporidiobolus poonsookiae]
MLRRVPRLIRFSSFSPSSSPPPLASPSHSRSRLSPYLTRLHAAYPHTSPASLTLAFLTLHELTALVPLAALFAAFSALGLGGGIVGWAVDEADGARALGEGQGETGWADSWRGTVRGWLQESEDKAERVGRRYGLFGWAKETADERRDRRKRDEERKAAGEVGAREKRDLRVSGQVANVVASYLVVKALLPLRILVSLRLSPTLANGVIARYKRWRAGGA